MFLWLVLMLLVILLLALAVFFIYRTGGYKKQLTREEAINEAVKKAVKYRDRLGHDNSYVARLRKRFTRR